MPHDVDDAKARDVVARVAESGSDGQAVNTCFDSAEGERAQRVKHISESIVSSNIPLDLIIGSMSHS
jgi:hypothetical protein